MQFDLRKRFKNLVKGLALWLFNISFRKFNHVLIVFFGPSHSRLEQIGNSAILVCDKVNSNDVWCSQVGQIANLLETFQIDLIVDVGANHGQFALGIREIYAGEILSFEPVNSAFKALESLSTSDQLWKIVKMALGDSESRLSIKVPESTDFSSFLSPNEFSRARFGSQVEVAQTEEVTVTRLSSFLIEHYPDLIKRRVFLKMDTQGYDLKVFEGATEILPSIKLVLSEVSLIPIYEGMPHWTDSISKYESKGFGVVGLYPVNKVGNQVIEFDCLMSVR